METILDKRFSTIQDVLPKKFDPATIKDIKTHFAPIIERVTKKL
jgi:hypothetical protein